MNMAGTFTAGTETGWSLTALRKYRLARMREQMAIHDVAGIVLFDSVNLRYATDTTNMQVWGHHNPVRYAFIATSGPVIIFDATTMLHLYDGFDLVDELSPCIPWTYFTAGPRFEENAKAWSKSIAALVREHGGGNCRLAVDRINPFGVWGLEQEGVKVIEGQGIMEHARVIKSADELGAIRCAISTAEAGMESMRQGLEPGLMEREVWSILHKRNIELGGEWLEGALFASGPRTNPWFKEASDRRIENGDIVAFDTDLIGNYGYCADISRTWICGDAKPTVEQQDLFDIAVEHLDRNMSMVKAGLTFREFAERSENLPERFRRQQYVCAAHGIGMCDEYPQILYWRDYENFGFDGVLETGMTICVESYVGEFGGKQGVKIEQQILVTDDGYDLLSKYPLDLLNSR
ncbi:Xaa-Pro peptidase family protein [Rhizobium sp. LjRoot98]|uniref:M24 family metallopeptidase n=1 Tax=unclassified Rhizobium TaxID=2613769 RepID=UPI000B28DE84|nr:MULTISPECIES: Xaa-Pro peptidase family protein [unclassified Rhizobium]